MNFYSRASVFRINYETLTRFLPVHAERYRSLANRQLAPAFAWPQATSIISNAEWTESKAGLVQLQIYPGKLLTKVQAATTMPAFPQDDLLNTVAVRELRNLKPPEWELVAHSYRLWTGSDTVKPSKKELTTACHFVAEHGPAKAKALVALATQSMRVKFPDAKTFGALSRYVPDSLSAFDKQQRQAELRTRDEKQQHEDLQEQLQTKAEDVRHQIAWTSLPAAEQDRIKNQVMAKYPRMRLDKHLKVLERMCIRAIAERDQQAPPPSIICGPENKSVCA